MTDNTFPRFKLHVAAWARGARNEPPNFINFFVSMFHMTSQLRPKSYFHFSRSERINLLKVIAANIEGKSYNSKLGCVWKVGSGSTRRVRGGTGSSGVSVGQNPPSDS